MDTAHIREFYVRYLTGLYLQRDLESMGQFFSPDVVAHPLPPGVPAGLTGLKLMARVWLDSFSDIRFTVESFIQEGGMAASRILVTAVHSGTFMGIAPTGRRVEIADHVHFRMHEGKVVEIWDQLDMMSLLAQIGALPAAAQAA